MMDGGIGVEKFVRYHLKAVIACHGFANQMLQNRSAGGLIGVVLYPFHNHSFCERPLCARCGRSMINSFGELSPQQRPAWLVSGSLTKLYPVFASDEPGANDESQRIAVACLYHRTIRREALVRPISQMDGCALAAMRCRDTVVFIAGEYPDDTRDHRRRGTTRHLCP